MCVYAVHKQNLLQLNLSDGFLFIKSFSEHKTGKKSWHKAAKNLSNTVSLA